MSVTKIPPQLRREVLDRFQVRVQPGKPALYRCAGCGKPFPAPALQIDHIQPEIDSTPEQRLDPANLQPLCAPRGAPVWKSCHRRKTAAETAARARLNRPPREWGKSLIPAALSALPLGYGYAVLVPGAVFTPDWWIRAFTASTVAAFCTFLVHNGFRHRAPLETISEDPETDDETERLDTARIVEIVRDKVGQKGDVRVTRIASPDDFTVTYTGTGFSDHKDDERYDFLEKFSAKIGGRWLPWWDTKNDQVRMTRRPDLPTLVHHPGLKGARPWFRLPIADGVEFDLMKTSHLLIVGETNSGKTAMLRAIIIAALRSAQEDDNIRVVLADPKRIEMVGFRDWPGIERIASKPQQLWDLAYEIQAEMDRRITLYEEQGVPLSSHKKWICIFDEFAEYFERVFDIWTSGAKDENDQPLKRGGEKVPGAIRALQSVIQMARKVGIHIIISTQSPDARMFGTSGVRQNLAGRATVGAIDDIRARMIFGKSDVGRDIPSSAKGRATVQIGERTPVECQTWWVPDPADADPNYDNTVDDWKTLIRLGMPDDKVPDEFKELVMAA